MDVDAPSDPVAPRRSAVRVGRSTPAVSVLMPVFDAVNTVDAALRSIRRQTRSDWECVVVDDGSTDGSSDVVRAHARADARVRPIRTAHAGLVAALTTGLAACRAPLVMRMDADDVMRRDRMERQVARLQRDRSLDLLGAHVRLFPRSALGPGFRAYERWVASIVSPEDVRREAFVECPLVHPTLTARTSVLRELGYRDVGWPEDYDLVLRALADGRRAAVEPRRLLAWRRSSGRLSESDPRYGDAAFARCKARFLADGPLAEAGSYRLWGYGATGRVLARELATLGRTPVRIVDVHPGRIGSTVRGAPVVPPENVGHPRDTPLLVSVAGRGPRRRIRAFLERRGFVDGRDFVCVA